MVIMISPYFVLLFVLYRVIRRPFGLAAAFFASHTVVCIASAIHIVQTTDGVERWARSLPIIIIDLPVTFVLAAWKPPGVLIPMYVFIAGGAFWAFVGWGFARLRQKMHDNESLTGRPREKSLYS
jgi:hypothetical protein